ncbi:MAG: hypothetical protein WCG06_05505, partial [Candidatus Omnitrophota bacterium]
MLKKLRSLQQRGIGLKPTSGNFADEDFDGEGDDGLDSGARLSVASGVGLESLDLDRAELVGRGGFSTVFKIPRKDTPGEPLIVKVYRDKEGYTEQEIFELARHSLWLSRRYPQLIRKGVMPAIYSQGVCGLDVDKIIPVDAAARQYPYVIMEYVPGRQLFDEMRQMHSRLKQEDDKLASLLRGKPDDSESLIAALMQPQLGEKLDLGLQVAKAVAEYHKAGLLVKDLKPGNIMVRPDGTVCIVDLDGVVPLKYDWARNPEGLPAQIGHLLTRKFSENFAAARRGYWERWGDLDVLLSEPWDVYSFGIVMAFILFPGSISHIINATGADDARISGTAERTLHFLVDDANRCDQLVVGFELAQLKLIYRIAAASCRVVQKCLEPSRINRYPDLQSPSDELEVLASALRNLNNVRIADSKDNGARLASGGLAPRQQLERAVRQGPGVSTTAQGARMPGAAVTGARVAKALERDWTKITPAGRARFAVGDLMDQIRSVCEPNAKANRYAPLYRNASALLDGARRDLQANPASDKVTAASESLRAFFERRYWDIGGDLEAARPPRGIAAFRQHTLDDTFYPQLMSARADAAALDRQVSLGDLRQVVDWHRGENIFHLPEDHFYLLKRLLARYEYYVGR